MNQCLSSVMSASIKAIISLVEFCAPMFLSFAIEALGSTIVLLASFFDISVVLSEDPLSTTIISEFAIFLLDNIEFNVVSMFFSSFNAGIMILISIVFICLCLLVFFSSFNFYCGVTGENITGKALLCIY